MSGKFALSLKQFATKVDVRANLVMRKILLDVGTSLVELSPVGDPEAWKHPAPKGYIGGHFRANWQYGNYAGGGIPTSRLDKIDPSGQGAVAQMAAKIPERSIGMIHVIVNNLPYAMRLETGWSQQAPSGMVGLTVMKYRSIVAKAAAELK
jgi:hypothetical protein